MSITQSDRTVFIGFHTDPEQKESLKHLAETKGISVSSLLDNLVGYVLEHPEIVDVERSNRRIPEDPSGFKDVALPFGDE